MMFISSDAAYSDTPKLDAIKLIIPKEEAMRLTQELFLEGRQINSLYVSTREELAIAEGRKRSWVAAVYQLFNRIVSGTDVCDYLARISLSVLKDNEPLETLSEQFHNELNQRLERLRMVRRMIDNSSEGEGAVMNALRTRASEPAAPPELIQSPQSREAQTRLVAPKPAPPKPATISKTKIILILCSRNGTARQALCRFASQMNQHFEIIEYNPEQPASIAEQLYYHRDAKFAIIYWGEPNGRELPGSAHPERYVGFALGFALGRLGRGRVFIMGSTTTPPLPGFTRVLASQLDSGGGWQIQLARRMKAAGVDIDLNKLT